MTCHPMTVQWRFNKEVVAREEGFPLQLS